mgnify:CR=1 FL=1
MRVASLFVLFPVLLSSPWAVPRVDSAGAGRGVKSAAAPFHPIWTDFLSDAFSLGPRTYQKLPQKKAEICFLT